MNNTEVQPPPICLGCQEINGRISQSINILTNHLIHIEIACRCNKCGKFVFTNRVYNNSLYVLQHETGPQLVKGN